MIKTYVYKSRVDPSQVVNALIADRLLELDADNRVTYNTL